MTRTILSNFLSHRYMLWSLSVHDFRSQYLDSMLGLLWALIKPLVMIGIYVVVFTSVLDSGTELKEVNFGLYVFAGMLPWLAIQESLLRGSTVMHDFSHLVRHHAIPLYILPFHLVLSATVSSFLATLVFILLKIFIAGSFSYHCLLIVAVLPAQIIFCFGLALLVSTVTVFIQDTHHFITAMLTVWFFASPIVFPRETLPWFLQSVWSNPLVGLTSIYRDLLLFNKLPNLYDIFAFSIFTLFILVFGMIVYGRAREEIVDWI